jgi:CheY-like chemotaxis protein
MGAERKSDERAFVLAVDDESDNVALIERALRGRPDVYPAFALSGHDALVILKERRTDVLILDQSMPLMSGVALLRAARAMGQTCIAIMLTAFPDHPEVTAAQDEGILPFVLVKPWSADDLGNALDMALTKKGRRQPTPAR